MPEIQSNELQVNQPIVVSAPDSQFVILVDRERPMKTGTYEFQLKVVDDAENISEPTRVRIVIFDNQSPTAVIDAPDRVGFGTNFALSGERSFDVGGRITSFIWTLIKTP